MSNALDTTAATFRNVKPQGFLTGIAMMLDASTAAGAKTLTWGTGAPNHIAPTSSMYIRLDATDAGAWLYRATDGAGNWETSGDAEFAEFLAAANAFTGTQTFQNVKFGASSELTIATGSVTATRSYHSIDTEADAASDDLDTIVGLADGEVLFIRPESGARTVVLKHGIDNIYCPGGIDISLAEAYDWALLVGDASRNIVIAHSVRGVKPLVTGSYFTSTEQTGTGAAQNVAHGLGSTPSMVWWSISDAAAGLTAGPPPVLSIAPGAHDATNCVFTVSTGVKFYVHALK